jgi:hypothetical protein
MSSASIHGTPCTPHSGRSFPQIRRFAVIVVGLAIVSLGRAVLLALMVPKRKFRRRSIAIGLRLQMRHVTSQGPV